MRKLRNVVGLFLLGMLMWSSCDDEEHARHEIKVEAQLSGVSGNGGQGLVTVFSPAGSWTAQSSEAWCVLSPSSGDTKAGIINLQVAPNLTFEAREAQVVISAPNSADVEVVVMQGVPDGMELLEADVAAFEKAASAGEYTFTLTSSTISWEVSTPVSWLAISPAEGGLGEHEMKLTLEENTGGERKSYLTFSGLGAQELKLSVTQKAVPYPSYNTDPAEPDQSGMESEATALAAKILAGWNLGNSLEAIGSETAWGNPRTTKAMIDMVKAAGFNAVRIPCAWNQYSDQNTAKINVEWLARVKEVVDYCMENDMYAIINIHWDGGWLENNIHVDKKEEVNRRQQAFWEQIATYFRDYDERLLFAGTNEPHAENASEMSVLLSYLQTFVDAVRSTGGKNHYRNLIVQGPVTDIDKTYDLMHTMPSDVVDKRLMLEVHYYSPWPFCGLEEDANWGNMAYFWGADFVEPLVNNVDRNALSGESLVDAHFEKMRSKFFTKGIPIIMGEYGSVNRSNLIQNEEARLRHEESRAYYLEYVTRKMKQNGMVPFYWDNGHLSSLGGVGSNSFAVFNRNTLNVIDSGAIDAIIRGATLQE